MLPLSLPPFSVTKDTSWLQLSSTQVGNDSVLFFSWCHPFTLEEKWDTELVNSSRKMTQYWSKWYMLMTPDTKNRDIRI